MTRRELQQSSLPYAAQLKLKNNFHNTQKVEASKNEIIDS